jgi:tetratricopeptide (TPR) repeat protein
LEESDYRKVEKLVMEFKRCLDSDMLTDAIDCLDKIIELDPSNDGAWTTKGKTMSMMAVNLRDDGMRIITAIERTSNDQKRLLKEALKCFKKAIDINPKSDLAFQYQALTLSRLGRKDQALESNNIAIELNPNNFEAGVQGTSWLINLGRFEEAYEVCKRLKQSSGLGMMSDALRLGFFSNFAAALVGLERYEEALVEINRAIDLDDKVAALWAKKGNILFSLHMTGYLECFDNAIALEPDNKLWKEAKSEYL